MGNIPSPIWKSLSGRKVSHIGDEPIFPAVRAGSYEIPETVERIGGHAFTHSHLDEILIPEGVASIAWHVFDGCVNLKRIVFPDAAS